MAVSERRGSTRIETGTVHPKNVVVLSRLAYIATSDFPLGRSSVQERPEEEPRAPTEEPPEDVSAFAFHTRFSYNSHLFSLLSGIFLSPFNIPGSFIVLCKSIINLL